MRLRLRACAALAAGALAGVSVLVGAPVLADAQPPLTEQSVAVAVDAVTPTTPAATHGRTPLTFQLTLTNRSDENLAGLRVEAERGIPITTARDLDAAIARPGPPVDASLVGAVPTRAPVTASLAPATNTTVTYRTTSSLVNDGKSLCICAKAAIYPIFFTVEYTDPSGATLTVGTAQTYLPAFDAKPHPVRVSWLWPLIDAPHRVSISDPHLFADDELASSVSTGRLSRVLRVAELVTRSVPMTLVADPELIDELAVMSTGKYRVSSGTKTVPGTGAAAARTWLARLRSVLARPGVELEFTAPADPDIESLTRAGLSWRNSLDPDQQQEVTAALGGHVGRTDILWPNGESLDPVALAAVAGAGTTTVVLNDATLPPAPDAPVADALSPVATAGGPLVAAVTSAGIQRYVATVLSVGGAGTTDLPILAAEAALPAVQARSGSPYVVIVPPRMIDPVPEVADRAIRDLAHSRWASALPLGAATSSVVPVERAPLVAVANPPLLPGQIIRSVRTATRDAAALHSMLLPADAATLLSDLPEVAQRATSSAWTAEPSAGVAFAGALTAQLDAISGGVYIQRPSTGVYTLASRNSPLPLTIDNTLPYPVQVKVAVSAVDGLGFSATTPGAREVPAQSRLTLRIATHVERTGRFLVQARLLAPNDMPVGAPLSLSVRSTALGTIGILITVVAGVVLVVALLVRFWRRLRRRRRRAAKAPPPRTLVAP